MRCEVNEGTERSRYDSQAVNWHLKFLFTDLWHGPTRYSFQQICRKNTVRYCTVAY